MKCRLKSSMLIRNPPKGPNVGLASVRFAVANFWRSILGRLACDHGNQGDGGLKS